MKTWKKIYGIIAVITGIVLVFAFIACDDPNNGQNNGDPAAPYIITGSSGSFTAAKGGKTIWTGAIGGVGFFSSIRQDANGADCTIQFGDGTNVLDIGNDSVDFVGAWGKITITGKITSSNNFNTVSINSYSSGISINSTADITNTYAGTENDTGNAIRFGGSNTFTISGGTVLSTGPGGKAVWNNNGTLIINGGTIKATGSEARAVYQGGSGSAVTTINGGTIEATGTNSYAVYKFNGTMTISDDATIIGNTFGVENGGNINDPGRNVYVAGYYRNGSTDVPCYWKNGVRVDLPTGSQYKTFTVVGSDIYVLSESNSTADSRAGYWKNGTKVELSNIRSGAEAITVIGSDVYVAGWYNDGSTKYCYWKNGTKTDLQTPTPSPTIRAIAVSGSDVYVSGSYMTNSPSIATYNCYWKNGVRTNITTFSNPASAFTVAGSDIYFAGGFFYNNNNVAGYSKNGTLTTLHNNSLSNADAITVAGSDVYVAGRYYNNIGVACYWKNGTRTDLTTVNGAAYDISIAGSDVYVTGFYSEGSNRIACYWKNGTKTDLSSVYSEANRIFVVDE